MKNLTVIFDCSGSVAENGKIEILRALRLTVTRVAKNFGANILLISYGSWSPADLPAAVHNLLFGETL